MITKSVIFCLICSPFICFSQGFVNLDFENANVSGYSPNSSSVPTDAAFPGWTTVYYQPGFGDQPVSQVAYDAISIGGAIISVNDTNTGFGFVPLEGQFSAFLFGGSSDVSSAISQTGLVPASAKSIRMEIGNYMAIGSFSVSLNGQMVEMVPLGTFSTYTLYGGDILPFVNQVATLSITAAGVTSGPGPNPVLLDDIQFSSSPVPEPSAFALSTLGGLLLAWRYRRKASIV